MFAVPGWSLSADKLKSEAAPAAAAAASKPAPIPTSSLGTGANSAQPSKKRKRPAHAGPHVTADNVADLWERVIEKKGRGNKGGQKPHGRREEGDGEEAVPRAVKRQKQEDEEPSPRPNEKKEKKKEKKQKLATAAADVAAAPKQEPSRDNKPTKNGHADKPARPSKKDANALSDKAVADGRPVQKEQKPADEKTRSDKKKDKKKGKKDRDADEPREELTAAAAKPPAVAALSPAPPAAASALSSALALPPTAAKLTPLQAAMRQKLVSARFRHLNETLYTSPSSDALRLFAESPDMFQAYHEGFRQQVAVWPENPVEGYIAEVRRRAGSSSGAAAVRGKGGAQRGGGGRGRGGRGGRGGGFRDSFRDPSDTLPRTRGLCRLADVGCGDARLAAALQPDASALRIEVLSYDLHADPAVNPHITAAADAADLPLESSSVDVVVFCLALMGTNWLAFVEEAYRVLRWKGELWVAEIKSRFAGGAELRARTKLKQQQQPGQPVSHSVGYRRKSGAGKSGVGKKKGGAQEEDDPDVVAAATAEVDGFEEGAGGGATDVSAFVRALRRRGFVLDDNNGNEAEDGGEGQRGSGSGRSKPPAVDLSNKMFVKMRFIKAAAATVGKEEVMAAMGGSGRGVDGLAAKKKLKFLDGDSSHDKNGDPMDDPALEAKILKPCVYKLR